MKRSIHYITLKHFVQSGPPGELYSKKCLPTSNVAFDTKGANFEVTLPHKNYSKIKTPSSNSLILVLFCWKTNVLLINALTNLNLSLISLESVIVYVLHSFSVTLYVAVQNDSN